MKKILGLDLGTNSIGWAVVNADEIKRENETSFLKPNSISSAGSRIIPMDEGILGDFNRGNTKSQTKDRTDKRGARRLLERGLLRRERLLRILKLMHFLPEHFAQNINDYGRFTDWSEPKLAWRKGTDGKFEFIFKDSFNEMLADFAKKQPQLVTNGKKVPYDWTIYYLRKKALTQQLHKEELAWILLQFNQKRGYYQLRGEEEDENPNEKIEIISAKILSVERKEKDKKYEKYWYEMPLDNGLVYRAAFYNDVSSWVNETKEFVLKTTILKDGSKKEELSFLPTPDEIEKMDAQRKGKMYAKIKLRTEKNIDNSHKTIGCYIYDALLANPNQKIIGKLVRTVERKYYKEELRQILKVQESLIPELQDKALYEACIEEMYPNNEAHRNYLAKPDFTNLFINDILFYQRPLKKKKSLISDCPYESRKDKDGNEHSVKCIAKSNPLYQEFRLWQFVQNLRIYERNSDIDVTAQHLSSEDKYVDLFDWLNDRATIKQETLLKSYFKFKKEKGKDQYPYRWNYVEDKEYPCNKTRASILVKLDKNEKELLSKELVYKIWHLLYSVTTKAEIEAVFSDSKKNKQNHHKHKDKSETITDGIYKTLLEAGFSSGTISKIKNIKFDETDYGSYSEKAIKKLLPLMRMGKYWSTDAIDVHTKDRIGKIITGEYDETIGLRTREQVIKYEEKNGYRLDSISLFKRIPVFLACYIVYDRHSETNEITKWEKPEDIDKYLKEFKQHSLRNPIVEQVVTETLRTVRDIWKQEGQIDEIHVELGREMKNPADKRKKMTERIQENENTNLRIKAMLMEFMNPEMGIENVRPYSPSQQDILRIYEENALDNLTKEDKEFDFISKVSKQAQPSKSDIIRYKCWLEQKYRSPYTGDMIPLAKLFTSAYEIEHVIPQSRYFDDSLSNKVICEAEVNKLKDRQLGFEFIKNHHGEKVQLSQGKTAVILSVEAYEKFVKDHYANNRTKMKKLLMDDIPDGFIERQLNDSRYISKLVKSLLSNTVRDKDTNGEWEQEAVSKNVISCNGSITDRLKNDWGMNDVWNSIVLPRFKRLNQLTGKDCFTKIINGHEVPDMPLELQKGFQKKRIDHRHHAMDAIVIACTTRDHLNLLNNEAAHSKRHDKSYRYDLQTKLRRKDNEGHYKEFLMPWETFTTDAKRVLENIIISFKQKLRVINKTTNYYQHYNAEGKKENLKQEKGDSWAIRKSMHKDTVFGEVNLRFPKLLNGELKYSKPVSLLDALNNPKTIVNKDFKAKVLELLNAGRDAKYIKKYVEDNKDIWSDININKVDVYYFTKETKDRYFATRKPLDTTFNKKKIEECITDTGIQKILLAHLETKSGDPELAFSPDGIDEMNRNIVALNNGKFHQPIYKVRYYESSDKKFSVGQFGNKSSKYVEADDGTNMYFVVYKTTANKRTYATIPFEITIECQKECKQNWVSLLDKRLRDKSNDEKLKKYQRLDIPYDAELLFILSVNDLVYLPSTEEIETGIIQIDTNRIYKTVSFNKKQCFCIQYNVAIPIVNKVEFTTSNKAERAIAGEMIKETCIPIKVDRLGNIIELNNKQL